MMERLSPGIPMNVARRRVDRDRFALSNPSWMSTALAMLLLACAGCTDRGEPIGGPQPAPVPPPFRAASTCGGCHPQHLAEWEASTHAYGGVDPLMQAMSELARQEVGEERGGSCKSCHAAALTRQEQWLAAGHTFSEEHPEEDLTTDGVSCDVCHSVNIVPPVGSIDFLVDVDPRGPKLGGIADPIDNSFHASLVDDSFRTSVQCGFCHQVHAANGTGLENTMKEWTDSILSGMGIECQDCHMPPYSGTAAVDGPLRTVHRHDFVGVDYAYEPFRGVDLAAQKQAIRDLLQGSVAASLDIPPPMPPGDTITVRVPVTNSFTGHAIPSGVTFAREMWIALVVKDANGTEIYTSGQLEPNGDLHVSPDLVKFGAVMRDANGDPTFFTWRAESIDESGLIQYGQTRTGTWIVPVPVGTPRPLSVTATLRFRPVSPAMVRSLDLERLLPIEIFDMWTETKSVPLP